MKGKIKTMLSTALIVSMLGTMFGGTAFGAALPQLFKDGEEARFIVSSTYDSEDMRKYQEKDMKLAASPAQAIASASDIASNSEIIWSASPSEALEIDDKFVANWNELKLTAAPSYRPYMNRPEEKVTVSLNVGGNVFQSEATIVANWFNTTDYSAEPQVAEVELKQYWWMDDLPSGKDCTLKMFDSSDKEMNNVKFKKDQNIITVDVTDVERTKSQRYKIELYNKSGKLCGFCYITLNPKPTLEVDGKNPFEDTAVSSYIAALSDDEKKAVRNLKISGGSMSATDWSSIQKLVNLETLTVGADVDTSLTSRDIKESTFKDMTSLKTVSINEPETNKKTGPRSAGNGRGILQIKESAFSGCTSLETVKIPGVVRVCEKAFENCEALTALEAPDLIDVEDYAFSGCKNLKDVNLPSADELGYGVFENCTKLESISLPKVTAIYGSAFKNCVSLNYMELPQYDPGLWTYAGEPVLEIFKGVKLPIAEYKLINSNGKPLSGQDLSSALRDYAKNEAWRTVLGLPDPHAKGTIGFAGEIKEEATGWIWGDSMEACLNQLLSANPGCTLADITRIDGVMGTMTAADWRQVEKLTGLTVFDMNGYSYETTMPDGIPDGLRMPKTLVAFYMYPSNDVEIPAGMFENCTSLSVVAMSRVTRIGSRAFANCTGLGNGDFRLPDVPPTLGDDVFAGITAYPGALRTITSDDATLARYKAAGGQWLIWFGENPPKTPQGGSSSHRDKASYGSWIQDANGWKYVISNKNAVGQWAYLPYASKFSWYYFDQNGYMMTGWFTDAEGRTYYLNPVSDGTRGQMAAGWKQIDGKWYYFSEQDGSANGMLLKSARTPDGYQVDANGVWIQ